MQTTLFKNFVETTFERVGYEEIKNNLDYNIGQYFKVLPNGKQQFKNFEHIRQTASQLKTKAIKNLYYNLRLFETRAAANKIKVLWAEDKDDALSYIRDIVQDKNATTIVKSKSMVTEEIHLNDFLENIGVDVFETDLGEFIQQLDGEPPIHILTPAMHKSKQNVADLFHQKLGVEENLSPDQLTKIARAVLRKKFIKAEIGITGANFILPDIGGIALTENEGNARLTIGFPKTHIVLVGIEKVIPSANDLALFWPLLSTMGTGQKVTSYNTIVTGPKTLIEKDGPDEMYVILLDNGRTNIVANEAVRESLNCIRCGACLNACPIYKNVAGGHAYLATYTGPIGSVITPHLQGMEKQAHLSFASSLCGACTEVCPVKIPLHKLLVENRKQAVEQNLMSMKDKLISKLWLFFSNHYKLSNMIGHKMKSFIINNFIGKKWQQHRGKITLASTSFRELYKQYKKNRNSN